MPITAPANTIIPNTIETPLETYLTHMECCPRSGHGVRAAESQSQPDNSSKFAGAGRRERESCKDSMSMQMLAGAGKTGIVVQILIGR